ADGADVAFLGIERAADAVLAALARDGPGDDHAGLVRGHAPVDAHGELAEQRRAVVGHGRVVAGAIERGPDELRAHPPVGIGQRHVRQPGGVAHGRARPGAGGGARALALGPLRAAGETGGGGMVLEAAVVARGGERFDIARRARRRELHLGRRRARDQGLARAHLPGAVGGGRDRERRIERYGHAQPHVHRAAHGAREQAAEIAAVPGCRRPVVATVDGDDRGHPPIITRAPRRCHRGLGGWARHRCGYHTAMTATGSAPHCESTLTMASALARAARRYPKRPAVLDVEGDLPWAQWVERIARAAAVLAGLGLRPGDRFAIIGRNSFRHAELINGAYWLGAIPVPINIRLAPPEMRHILDDAGCRLLALEDRYLGLHDDPHFAPWRARAMVFGRAPRSGTLPDYERLLAEARPAELHLARPADDAILLYTGGTTGRSKGVPLAHAHILANALQFGLATRAYAEDRYLHVSPLFHSGGLIGTVFTLVGGAHHYPSDISGRAMLEAIERHRLTITNMPPTVVFMMLEDPDIDRFDVSSLRLLFYGSAPMAPEWIK